MLSSVRFKILENQDIPYTGAELRPHWGLEQTNIYGSLITVFLGACTVTTDELVDMEDRLASDFIRAERMLHLIAEFYGTTLESGVLYQRLLMDWASRLLREAGIQNVFRQGDDLMIGDSKLSVSIATASTTSVLIHWGINIDSTGAPVKAIGLKSFGYNDSQVLSFAKKLLTHYISELEEIQIAQCKVRAV